MNEKDANDDMLSMELEAINLWVARILYHMANICKVTGNVDDSFSWYEEALRIRSQCKGTKKYSLNNALINSALAKALRKDQKYDKSIYCYAKFPANILRPLW